MFWVSRHQYTMTGTYKRDLDFRNYTEENPAEAVTTIKSKSLISPKIGFCESSRKAPEESRKTRRRTVCNAFYCDVNFRSLYDIQIQKGPWFKNNSPGLLFILNLQSCILSGKFLELFASHPVVLSPSAVLNQFGTRTILISVMWITHYFFELPLQWFFLWLHKNRYRRWYRLNRRKIKCQIPVNRNLPYLSSKAVLFVPPHLGICCNNINLFVLFAERLF